MDRDEMFEALVRDVVSEDSDIDPWEVVRTLNACGRTFDDLKAAIVQIREQVPDGRDISASDERQVAFDLSLERLLAGEGEIRIRGFAEDRT